MEALQITLLAVLLFIIGYFVGFFHCASIDDEPTEFPDEERPLQVL